MFAKATTPALRGVPVEAAECQAAEKGAMPGGIEARGPGLPAVLQELETAQAEAAAER